MKNVESTPAPGAATMRPACVELDAAKLLHVTVGVKVVTVRFRGAHVLCIRGRLMHRKGLARGRKRRVRVRPGTPQGGA